MQFLCREKNIHHKKAHPRRMRQDPKDLKVLKDPKDLNIFNQNLK